MKHSMKHGTAHDKANADMVETASMMDKSEAYRSTKRMPRRMQSRAAKRGEKRY